MTYQAQADLAQDADFQARSGAAATEQASIFKNDQRGDYVALAQAVLRGDGVVLTTFTRLNAAGPGVADKVESGNGIDQSQVTDADLLSLTQSNWPTIADLYFNDDGSPV